MGGASATIAALHFKKSSAFKNKNVLVYSYGGPRIGN